MIAPHIKKTSELAMVMALPDLYTGKGPGRVKGACEKAAKEALKELERLPKISESEKESIRKFLDRFDDLTKWRGNPKHLATLISFLCELFDGRYPRIMKYLNKIENHFGRIGKTPDASLWAGSMAFDKWNQAMEMEFGTE